MTRKLKDGPPVQTPPASLRKQLGFSIIELLVVVGIIVAISAISFPSVTRSLRVYRLNGIAATAAGSLQLARLNAVRLNRSNPPVTFRWIVQGNQNVMWVDLNNNGGPDATEPQQMVSTEMQILTTGSAPSVASMGYPNTQISPPGVAFDPRGSVNFGAAAPTVYVFVFGYTGRAAEGYTAVSVLPTGKTQQWRAAAGGPWQKR